MLYLSYSKEKLRLGIYLITNPAAFMQLGSLFAENLFNRQLQVNSIDQDCLSRNSDELLKWELIAEINLYNYNYIEFRRG